MNLGTDFLNKINEFSVASGLVRYFPNTMPLDIRDFRESLIYEEYNELLQAIADNDRVEQLDALADLLYVMYGYMWVGMIPLMWVPEIHKIKRDTIVDTNQNLSVRIKAVLITANDLNLFLSVEEAFNRVHVSNMSKFCKTEQEAIDTVASYKEKGTDTYYNQVNELYVVYRTLDNKVLKSINYTKVDLKDLV